MILSGDSQPKHITKFINFRFFFYISVNVIFYIINNITLGKSI